MKMGGMGLLKQFGLGNVIDSVQKQASDTVTILNDRQNFI